MALEDRVKARIQSLIESSQTLVIGDAHEQAQSEKHCQQCSAWLTAAQNAVHLVCDNPDTPYRKRVDAIAAKEHGWVIHNAVGEVAAILSNLVADAEAGLLASVADQARAETYDNFLDHAQSYLAAGRKNEAGVIGGVTFEDTIRRICRNEGVNDKGVNLDGLISALTSRGTLAAIKAKRARVAAHVRTKATHAQWDEFDLNDVKTTIDFTRELLESILGA